MMAYKQVFHDLNYAMLMRSASRDEDLMKIAPQRSWFNMKDVIIRRM